MEGNMAEVDTYFMRFMITISLREANKQRSVATEDMLWCFYSHWAHNGLRKNPPLV